MACRNRSFSVFCMLCSASLKASELLSVTVTVPAQQGLRLQHRWQDAAAIISCHSMHHSQSKGEQRLREQPRHQYGRHTHHQCICMKAPREPDLKKKYQCRRGQSPEQCAMLTRRYRTVTVTAVPLRHTGLLSLAAPAGGSDSDSDLKLKFPGAASSYSSAHTPTMPAALPVSSKPLASS